MRDKKKLIIENRLVNEYLSRIESEIEIEKEEYKKHLKETYD